LKIIFCSHSRELLIALIEFFSNKKSVLVLRMYDDQISKRIVFEIKKLQLLYNNRIVIYELTKIDDKKTKITKAPILLNNLLLDLVICLKLKMKHNVEVCNTFFESIYPCKFFKFFCSIDLLEHGSINYQPINENGASETYGRAKFVRSIKLLKPERAPEDIQEKVCKLPLYENFKSISTAEREIILQVFGVPVNNSNSSKRSLLVTQPFSEDGFVSEQKKISIYKKLIKSDTVIKPHPREVTDYSCHFTNEVMQYDVPLELYVLSGYDFYLYITVYSSIVFSLSEDSQIQIMGVDFDKELYEGVLNKKPSDSKFTKSFFSSDKNV
jgi:hypothetical protein